MTASLLGSSPKYPPPSPPLQDPGGSRIVKTRRALRQHFLLRQCGRRTGHALFYSIGSRAWRFTVVWQENPPSGPWFGSEWRLPGYPVLIGSGTMDVGELLSYQVGAVGKAGGRLTLARVAGSESRRLASSRSLALTSPGLASSHCTSLSQVLVDPFDLFLLRARDLFLVISVPHPAALSCSSVSFLPIQRA